MVTYADNILVHESKQKNSYDMDQPASHPSSPVLEMAKRGNWKNWYEFLFSCIGCLVGLGNIWRFPYLCYKNGGGAFLIPYFMFMFLCAFPLFFLEMSYAQFSNLGPGRAWICVPLLRGIGHGMVIMTGVVAIYYNVILSWAIYYFAMSFNSVLPWSTCNNDWNTDYCYLRITSNTRININQTDYDLTVTQATGNGSHSYFDLNNTAATVFDVSLSSLTKNVSLRRTPTEEFWEFNVLELTDGIEDQGYLRWQLVLCLLGAWTVVFLCLIKGIKSSGKVMYIAATVPYILLTILLVRGLTLPGAWNGFKYYAIPRWEQLSSFTVWSDAAIQMFYSAGMGWGGISTLASYNDFHNNLERDAILLPVLDCLTSWFAGCVIFVNLGYMAYSAGVGIDQVISQGPGIAFMVYPEALSRLPLPQLWSVLFFLMLFTVGLDSQIVHVQTLTSALVDCFPKQLMKRELLVTATVCIVLFLLGLTCVTQGGVYVLQVLDWYCASVSVMFLAFMEIFGLAWVYGIRRLYKDIELMLGRKLTPVWGVFWRFITPAIIILMSGCSLVELKLIKYDDSTYPQSYIALRCMMDVLSIMHLTAFEIIFVTLILIWGCSLAQLKPVKYGDTTYPQWSIAVGWMVALLSIIPLPMFMIVQLRKSEGDTLLQKLKISIRPSPKWVPVNTEYREQYKTALEKETFITSMENGGY